MDEEAGYNLGLAQNPLMPMYDPLAYARVNAAPEGMGVAIRTQGLRPAPIEMPRVAGIGEMPPHHGAEDPGVNQLAPNVPQGPGTDQLNSLQGLLSMKGLMDVMQPSLGAVYESGMARSGAGAGPGRIPTGASVDAAAKPYQAMIDDAAKQNGVSPQTLKRLLYQESQFDPKAVSPAGARGIGQFMPGTAKDEGVDVNDPKSSIYGAAKYLSKMIKKFNGNEQLGMAAYNTGPGNVLKWLQGKGRLEDETYNYVRAISGRPLAPNQSANVPTAAAGQMAAEVPNASGGFPIPGGNFGGLPDKSYFDKGKVEMPPIKDATREQALAVAGEALKSKPSPVEVKTAPEATPQTAPPAPTESTNPVPMSDFKMPQGAMDDPRMKRLWQFMLMRSLFPPMQFRNVGYDPWAIHRYGQGGGY